MRHLLVVQVLDLALLAAKGIFPAEYVQSLQQVCSSQLLELRT